MKATRSLVRLVAWMAASWVGVALSVSGGQGTPSVPLGSAVWASDCATVRVVNEVTGDAEVVPGVGTVPAAGGASEWTRLAKLGLEVQQTVRTDGDSRATWDLNFRGEGPRVGHQVEIEFRGVLSSDRSVFTPSQSGVMDLAVYPSFTPPAYATLGWDSGQAYVLPLVSVSDPARDRALTLALPADANIPHLQVAWTNAAVLRLTMKHRAMGGGRESALRMLAYTHPADYRSALRSYSDDFPAYFRPVAPRAAYEGAFWYHHIHEHPDVAEMQRQNVRHIWASFWFTHLGEYLPDASEWEPYTYAKWWKLGQTMTDGRIRDFLREMHARQIAVHAYFNVTEYGGAGGKSGDTATAAKILRERFADALVKNEEGHDIPTWEGALAMNPGKAYALWPFLEDQVRRHLQRLPEIDGFTIDRLDWASLVDYGHDDGFTRIGDRSAANLAVPIGEAVREICRLAHDAGKRVFVNQFYRIEPLRDVDGYCHENDFLPALAYLSPYRFACAWHMRKPYQGDLLPFEAQLKRRLLFALFPQMIAHEFPISQQAADPRAADLLEIYAPLFQWLTGKTQVLLPHCVGVTGVNDVNLFRNAEGNYVAPVISRTRFLARRPGGFEPAVVTLSVPDAGTLTWARVYSPDGPAQRATLRAKADAVELTIERHGTVSVVVAGRGAEPPGPDDDRDPFRERRERLFPSAAADVPSVVSPTKPELAGVQDLTLAVEGDQLAQVSGVTEVRFNQTSMGRLSGSASRWAGPVATDWGMLDSARVAFRTGDEGTWFAPSRLQLLARTEAGRRFRVAEWTPDRAAVSTAARMFEVRLAWCAPVEVPLTSVHFRKRDGETGGDWVGRFGRTTAWLPLGEAPVDRHGFRLTVEQGQTFEWPSDASQDVRVLRSAAGPPRGRCWFAGEVVRLRVDPPSAASYRLSVYLLDYDRNGRSANVALSDEWGGQLDQQAVARDETERGLYLTWSVTGPVSVNIAKTAGFNAVASAVFVDPEP